MSNQINCDFCDSKNIPLHPGTNTVFITFSQIRHVFHMCKKCCEVKGIKDTQEEARSILDELMDQLIEEVAECVQANI